MDIDQIMNYAVDLSFNGSHEVNQAPAIGVAFGNTSFPKEASDYLKSNFPQKKFVAEILAGNSVLTLTIKLEDTLEKVFTTTLNYLPYELKEFVKMVPKDEPLLLLFGTRSQCNYYIVSAEPDKFQPFILKGYSLLFEK